jgi:dipeptide/tripeptide permease
MSNLFMEFLFTITVKGIALGFGFFYIIEAIIETKRIIEDKSNEQTDKQNEILKQLLFQCKILFATLLLQMIYILICYIVRFISGCCCESNERNRRNNSKKLLSEESLLNEHNK